MNHFPFSFLDLLTFGFYVAWFVFLVWFGYRLVRALRAIEDASRSLRTMSSDLRYLSDDLRAIREKLERPEPRE